MINTDMTNNFVITIFKIFYAFKNKEISYSKAATLVNGYVSDKIRQIKPIEIIGGKTNNCCPVYINPPIKLDNQHERNKESKRKYYEK